MTIKLPPLVVLLVFGGLMYLLDLFLPVGEFDFFGRTWLALFLLGLGILTILISVIQFRAADTSTNPLDLEKTVSLVSGGIYKYSRNPMYLVMLLLVLSFGLHLEKPFST